MGQLRTGNKRRVRAMMLTQMRKATSDAAGGNSPAPETAKAAS